MEEFGQARSLGGKPDHCRGTLLPQIVEPAEAFLMVKQAMISLYRVAAVHVTFPLICLLVVKTTCEVQRIGRTQIADFF